MDNVRLDLRVTKDVRRGAEWKPSDGDKAEVKDKPERKKLVIIGKGEIAAAVFGFFEDRYASFWRRLLAVAPAIFPGCHIRVNIHILPSLLSVRG